MPDTTDGIRGRERLVAIAVALVFLALGGVGGPLIGRLSEVQENDNAAFLPQSAESTKVNTLSAEFADDKDVLPYFVVIEKATALTPADLETITTFTSNAVARPIAQESSKTVGDFLKATPAGAIPSADGLAVLIPILANGPALVETVGEQTALYLVAEAIRAEAAQTLEPAGLTAYVTGPGGLFADFVTAFAGIDGLLLYVALGVVFVILLLVYKSPFLPFTVLISAGVGLGLAALIVYPLAKNGTIELSGQSQGILSILVVGAATDYALLLVARFREELHDHENTLTAMKVAWRASLEPIAASAATVILGLLCLLLSDLGNTRGLGPVGALGIAGAFVVSLTLLPAILVIVGRRIFWPRIPRVDHVHRADAVDGAGVWGRVARLVGTHPRRTWTLTLVALLALAAFAPTFKADGISSGDLFLTEVESVKGQEALARHFPAGSGSPVQVLVPQDQAEAAATVMTESGSLRDVFVGEQPGQPPKVVEGLVQVQGTFAISPDGPAAEDAIRELRVSLREVSPVALVGGTTAINLDVRTASERDLRVIVPAILVVIFIVLALLLRSLAAPVVLVVANVISFAATIGLAALFFNHVFDFPGSDPSTPLYAFVFLVALGIDYSIFLMTRAREESIQRGTRPGILVALAVTGGVITSAGIVLASTFSALALLPILFLVQIAFLVAVGVLIDTLVVRSLLVPAFGYDVGRRIWWPNTSISD